MKKVEPGKIKKTKLFIQVPCLNEENSLPAVIADLPRKIEGVDEIYTLIIDDGSTDRTIDVAEELGVDFIVKNNRNMGLTRAFGKGLEAALFLGADIIVNTDGDNQYRGADIVRLVRPVLDKKADVVVGCRDMEGQRDFSAMKKVLQRLGSRVVRRLSGTDVPDATSGFRAMTRGAAMRFSFMSNFSYTLEMLIQAGRTGMKVAWVPIRTNARTREGRLFKSIPHFIYNQTKTMLSAYIFYRPIHIFGALAALFFLLSALLAGRVVYFLTLPDPSMVKFKTGTGITLLFTSIVTVFFLGAGLLGSVLSGLRFLLVDVRGRLRNRELQHRVCPEGVEIIKAPQFFRWAWKDRDYRTKVGSLR